MFSGGESSDGVNSLNPLGTYGFVNQVAVSNAVAAGQNIDWAQLAQQWIQMRDNSELDKSVNCNRNAHKFGETGCDNPKLEEKGEADMDMDDEEFADDKATQKINNNVAPISTQHNNLNQSWLFGENSSEIVAQSTNMNQWNPWLNRESIPPPVCNQSTINNVSTNTTAHIPSLLKLNVPNPNEIKVMTDIPNQLDNINTMDAAKRKGLPAWIREGLEKMEREKQKQLEREQQHKDTISSNKVKASNKSNLVKSPNSVKCVPATVLEEESSDNEDSINVTSNSQTDTNLREKNEEDANTYSFLGNKTYEQKLADLMMAVRRTLTELLLEATNEELSKVANDTIKIYKSKASSAQIIRKSALSSLTGKLGLAVYGDSSSENDSDNEDCNSSKKTTGQSESDNNSEEEIRNVIRLKRRAFLKISEEIEERVAAATAREEEKVKYFMGKEEEKEKDRSLVSEPASSGHKIFKGYEKKDFGEISETKIQHPNGKRQKERTNRKERITRFSDNKDKYVALPNAATFLKSINNVASFGSGNSTTSLPTNSQRQNIPDVNGLLPNYTNTGMATVLNAADAALEKALKGKDSASPEKHNRRDERNRNYRQTKKRRLSENKKSRSNSESSSSSTSSSSSSSTSDSDSSSSRSSQYTKYKRRSAKEHKSRTPDKRQNKKSNKDRSRSRKYSLLSHEKGNRQSERSHKQRSASSDSEEDYRRRHSNRSNYDRKTSHTSSYTSSRHVRNREHSRSQSRSSYSSSSNRRQ